MYDLHMCAFWSFHIYFAWTFTRPPSWQVGLVTVLSTPVVRVHSHTEVAADTVQMCLGIWSCIQKLKKNYFYL